MRMTSAGIFVRDRSKQRLEKYQILCRGMVASCIVDDPVTKLLLRALKSYKCPVPVISCNEGSDMYSCYNYVYDEIDICVDGPMTEEKVCSQLNHKLVHAFDNCRAQVNHNSLSHMACAEIRAVNLLDCISVSEAKWSEITNSHKDCVRKKVLDIFKMKNVPQDRIRIAIDQVFSRCYNDLEPMGSRIRQFSNDPNTILLEGFYSGYMK